MANKILPFDVALKEINPIRSFDCPKAYTNDLNSVEFQFTLTDMSEAELVGATANVVLYMRDKSFFQNTSATGVTLAGNVVKYVMKENEGNHAGIAQVQVEIVYADPAKVLSSKKYNFEIVNGLEMEVAVEVIIEDWSSLVAGAEEYIAAAEAAEAIRLQSEIDRVAAEAIRLQSEIDRVAAENIRLANDIDRQANELLRQQRIAKVEEDLEVGIGAFTTDTETILARQGKSTLLQNLISKDKQLAETKNINNIVLLPNKKYPKILSEVSCNSLTGWTPVDGTTELSTIIDEINDHTIIDAVKFISTANGRVTKSLSTAIDGAVNPIMVQVYLEESENIDNMMTTVLEFYSDGNFTSGYRAETYIQYAEGNNKWTKDFARKGLFYLCQFPAEILRTKGVNFNVNNITGIGFHVYHPAATTRSIKIAKVAFVGPLQVGGCITIVDNFNVNVPAMCDYAYSKGVKLNVSVIPNSIKGGNAIISASKAELDRIKAQGHTIINHTYNHLTFNDLTNVGITDEIVKSENWMENNNYTKGSRILSIPSARFNTESYRATINTNVQGIYHNWTFTNSGGTNLNKIMCPYYPITRLIDTSSLDKLDEAITLCNKAVQYKGIVVNGYHGSFWSKDNGVSWKAYIDAISQIQGLKHYGIDEILEGKFV